MSGALDAAVLGETIAGRYRVEAYLGRGAMGEVYRALDEREGRSIAIKRLLREGATETWLRLFRREYHTLSQLSHPRIIHVFDYGLDEGSPYYTMELLEGADLSALAPMPVREACEALRDVASSLALLHARRLLHRDLSPKNVRRGPDGRCKLLDFGGLTPFGVPAEVVGTPPLVPPEALNGTSLDQRADLFALGALAYWMLTGRHAFAARQLHQLPACWAKQPPVPSALQPSVPKALDELVMALLSIDPLARPASAAEVIDKLVVIAGLPSERDAAAERGFLLNAPLVGRDAALARFDQLLEQAKAGKGAALMLEGHRGTGRTRMLSEVALRAKLDGAQVLLVDGRRASGRDDAPLLDLAQALRDAAPDSSIGPRSGASGMPARSHSSGFGRGEQDELLTAITKAANERTIVLLVDDVEHAGEAFITTLASIARSCRSKRLLLVAAAGAADQGEPSSAMRALQGACDRIPLRALAEPDLVAMMDRLFGAAPASRKLAHWLATWGGGNPKATFSLLQHLVDERRIRYSEGIWVLTADYDASERPPGLEDIAARRIASLSPRARALAEALVVFGGAVGLEECMAMSDAQDEGTTFEALDELVTADVLRADGEGYRFVDELLAQSLSSALPAERLTKLHRKAGRHVLATAGDSPKRRMQAGYHFLNGGEEDRGAELLRETAITLIAHRQHMEYVVPALEATLESYERRGRPLADRLEVQFLLAMATLAHDGKNVIVYGERVLSLADHYSGLPLARRLTPFVGRTLAMACGLAFAGIRWLLTRPSRRGPRPMRAVEMVAMVGGVIASVALVCFDGARLAALEVTLDPLRFLPKRHFGHVVLDSFRVNGLVAEGRLSEAAALAEELAVKLETVPARPSFPEAMRDRMVGQALAIRGVVETLSDAGEALPCADALSRAKSPYHRDVTTAQVHFLYHMHRGELNEAREWRERVELACVQSGNAWQLELWPPVILPTAYYRTGDVVGLKRAIHDLEARLEGFPGLQAGLDVARLAYAAARGHAEAGSLADAQPATIPAHRVTTWAIGFAAAAHVYNEAGEHARAAAVATKGLEAAGEDAERFVVVYLDLFRELAIAEAGQGRIEAARARIEGLIAKYAAQQASPLTMGALHQTAAELAIAAGDASAFGAHATDMGSYYRSTANPSLIAAWRHTLEKGEPLGVDAAALQEASWPDTVATSVLRRIESELQGVKPAERPETALEALLAYLHCEVGHLYLRDEAGLRRVASRGGAEPTTDIEEQVRNVSESVSTVVDVAGAPGDGDGIGFTTASMPAVPNGGSMVLVADASPIGGPLGVLVVEPLGSDPPRVSLDFIQVMTRVVRELGQSEPPPAGPGVEAPAKPEFGADQ